MSGPNAALTAQKLSFQVSPIILVGGIIPGGMLPIIAITESLNFGLGLLSGADVGIDDFFANFAPISGGTLIDNAVGTYPFANQQVAANAIINQPLHISMRMTCPARGPGGFAAKLATLAALQASISAHSNAGGTYTIATPSYFYTNCLLTRLSDVSGSQASQPQSVWQWDFVQPLLTEEQGFLAMGAMMQRIGGGVPVSGALSGLGLAVGNPMSLAAGLLPSASNLAGSSVANYAPFGGASSLF